MITKTARVWQVYLGQKRGRLLERLCLQCGGELALSFSPSQMMVADAARTAMTAWRCGTCGSTFSAEQLRSAKVKVKPVVPARQTTRD